jgi:hypothetical protein
MSKIVSEDALRRALGKIPEAEGTEWMRTECFESQYHGEIHRYYEERSQANMKTADPAPAADDSPF